MIEVAAALVLAGSAVFAAHHATKTVPKGATPTPPTKIVPSRPSAGTSLNQNACHADQLRIALGAKVGLPSPPASYSTMPCSDRLAWLATVSAGIVGAAAAAEIYAIAHATLTSAEYSHFVASAQGVGGELAHAAGQVANATKAATKAVEKIF